MEHAGECHKTTYTIGKTSILSINELSAEEVHLIVWRAGIRRDKFHTICLHHKIIFLNMFEFLHPFCSAPFKHHVDNKYSKGNFKFLWW